MAAARLFSSIASRFQAGPFVSEEPNLPSGGHSGYHPGDIRQHRSGGRRSAQPKPLGFQSTGPAAQYGQPGYTGYSAPQQMTQQTGYQPGGYPPRQAYPGTAAQPGYQQTAPGPVMGGTGYQPPQGYMPQQGYMPPQGYAPQTGYMPPQTGAAAPSTGTWAPQSVYFAPPQEAPVAPNGYRQNWPQRDDKPYENKFAQMQEQPEAERNRRFGREETVQPAPAVQPIQPVQQLQPLPDNVSYMPNVFVGSDGAAYRHVERLTQPMSAATCYRLIEFMRNGETVIVNTELIQDERENQRCLDLLYGAAYTMKCTFTRISAKSIYLIAPATVSVISYESIRQMNEQDAAVRWPGAESALLSGSRPRHQPVFGNARAAE